MLTRQQQKTLDFISCFIEDQEHAPTLIEIAAGIGIKSKGVVHRYLQALVSEGLIHIHSGRHRGIELIATKDSLQLPLLGRIAAGSPIEAIADQNRIDLGEMFLGEGRFALRVVGDSMVDAGILDGDTVIIRSRSTAAEGDIVVALIDGEEATLKRLSYQQDGVIMLIPENATMKPMCYPPHRVAIQGVLVGQMRTY